MSLTDDLEKISLTKQNGDEDDDAKRQQSHQVDEIQDVAVAQDSLITSPSSLKSALLSPFSSARKRITTASASSYDDLLSLSLDPCRKVSVVVCIQEPPTSASCSIPHHQNDTNNNSNSNNNESSSANHQQQQPFDESFISENWCLFPFSDPPNASSPSSSSRRHSADMVLVNPSAFGKFIPTQVTIETARLVHQVAHISSEDWARKYSFHDIIWPKHVANIMTTTNTNLEDKNNNTGNNTTLLSLALTLAQDAVIRHESRVVLNLGCRHAQKTMTLFGTSQGTGATTTTTSNNNNNDSSNHLQGTPSTSPPPSSSTTAATTATSPQDELSSMYDQCGLMGVTLHRILQLLPPNATVSLSMVELLPEDDHLWDWLVAMKPSSSSLATASSKALSNTTTSTTLASTTTSSSTLMKSPLKIRHLDSRGPVLEGLTRLRLDSWIMLPQILRRAFGSRRKRKHQPRGTLLTTLHITFGSMSTTTSTTTSSKETAKVASAKKETITSPPPPTTTSYSQSTTPSTTTTATTSTTASTHSVQIQFVNLVGLESKRTGDNNKDGIVGGTMSSRSILSSSGGGAGAGNLREYTAARKSLSSLGGVLRRLVERDIQQKQQHLRGSKQQTVVGGANSNTHETPSSRPTTTAATSSNSGIVSYRDSILTKLLQRTLEDANSRIVVLAHVSPLREDYDGTVHTLHYVHRFMPTGGGGGAAVGAKSPFDAEQLLGRGGGSNSGSGKTLSATTTTTIWPFQPRLPANATGIMSSPLRDSGETNNNAQVDFGFSTMSKSPILTQVDKRGLMRSYVSDPRQRLAKVFMLNQTPQKNVSLSNLSPILPTHVNATDETSRKAEQEVLEKANEGPSEDVAHSQRINDSIEMHSPFDSEDDMKYQDTGTSATKGFYDAMQSPLPGDHPMPPNRPVSPVAKLLDSPDFGMSPLARYLSTSQYKSSEQHGLDEESEPGSSLGLYGHPDENPAAEDIFLPEIHKSPVDSVAQEASVSTFWTADKDQEELLTSTSTATASPRAPYFASPRWDVAVDDHPGEGKNDNDEHHLSPEKESDAKEKSIIVDYLAGVRRFDMLGSSTGLDNMDHHDTNPVGLSPEAPLIGDDGVLSNTSGVKIEAEQSREPAKDPRYFRWDFVSSGETQASELLEQDNKYDDDVQHHTQHDALDEVVVDHMLANQRLKYGSDPGQSRNESSFTHDSGSHSERKASSSELDVTGFKDRWWSDETDDVLPTKVSERPKFDPEGLISTDPFRALSKRCGEDSHDLGDESIQGTPVEIALASTEMSSLLLRREMSRIESGSLHNGAFSPEGESPNYAPSRLSFDSLQKQSGGGIDSISRTASLQDESAAMASKFSDRSAVMDDWVNELERAISGMRDLHNGVWENSSVALRRLRVSLISLQQQLLQTKSERDEARSNVEFIRSEIRRELSRHQEAQADARIVVEELEAKLTKALADRVAVERIAEEAIASQDSMEKRMSRLKQEVESSQEDATVTKQQWKVLLQAKDDLSRDLRSAKGQIDRLEAEKREGDSALAKLSIHLQSVEAERQRLLRERQEDHMSMEELKRDIASQNEVSRNMSTNQLDSLMNERDELEQSVNQLNSDRLQLKEERDLALTTKAELEAKVVVLSNQVSRLKSDREGDFESMQKLTTELSRSKLECDAALSIKSTLEASEVLLKSQLASLRLERDNLEDSLSKQNEEIQRARQEQDQLLSSDAEREAGMMSLKTQLSKLKDEQLEKELAASREIAEMLHAIEERNIGIKRLKQEVARLQQLEGSTTAMQSENEQVHGELAKLVTEVVNLQTQLSDAAEREAMWQTDRHDLLKNMAQADQILVESREHTEDLRKQLEASKSKREKAEERARSMRAELSTFQEETKAKVHQVLQEQKQKEANITLLLNQANAEKVAVMESNHKLQIQVDRLLQEQHDGDSRRVGALFESWDNTSTTPVSVGVRPRPSNPATSPFRRLYDVSANDAAAITTSTDATTRDAASTAAAAAVHAPQVPLPPPTSLSGMSSLRAEEICSAIAVSAKSALEQSHFEVMKWKLRLAAVEDEKEAEIAVLRAKIRTLERNATAGFGSSSHSARPPSYYYNNQYYPGAAMEEGER